MSLIGSVETAAPAAFEALYQDSYTRVAQQTFLLTGHQRHADHCARRAFQLAWSNWDTVSDDPSPEGWVRAAAFELALSPWYPARLRRPDHSALGARDQQLLAALLRLPGAQRRALVLHDALGLSWEQTAREIESSTPAAYGRVVRARLGMARLAPQAAGEDAREPDFARRLGPLLRGAAVRGCPVRQEEAPPPDRVQQQARLRERVVNSAAGLAAAAVAAAVITGLAVGTPWHPAAPAFITFGHGTAPAPVQPPSAPPAPAPPTAPVPAAPTVPAAVQQPNSADADLRHVDLSALKLVRPAPADHAPGTLPAGFCGLVAQLCPSRR
ncbi:sigma factor-like helix-turn-helix DNA-binding protein [Streptacidiphilus sp. N1-3]|uniref:Sigma factor-like helix-turn-helix DNA-binding protein n=1 Tax=Streptacidiphilus alkalitolerans TaxID=3342712 RepID=A0ABV6X4L8_9ACTN